jgi:flavin reductase (DIM6/NTAB) family NADH-FMN oxidoreductase RutF
MFYDALVNDHGLKLDPYYSLVVPRPIAWISTVSKAGRINLAPYSFYNTFSHDPSYVAFGSSVGKHTITNIAETGEFVINMPTYELREAMNQTSTKQDVEEFDYAGLAKAPSRMVRPPRVAASPISLECRHFKTIDLPDDAGVVENQMVIGRVVGVHIDDSYIKEGRVDVGALQVIARLGYAQYATVENLWRMPRPD